MVLLSRPALEQHPPLAVMDEDRKSQVQETGRPMSRNFLGCANWRA